MTTLRRCHLCVSLLAVLVLAGALQSPMGRAPRAEVRPAWAEPTPADIGAVSLGASTLVSALDWGTSAVERIGQPDREPIRDSRSSELVGVDSATLIALHGPEPLNRHHPNVAEAIEIQERHGEILAHPAVMGTAIGLNARGEIALVVYTRTEATDLPDVVDGLPVVVQQSDEFVARQDAVGKRDDVKPRTHTGGIDGSARFARPVPIGVSTGHPAITAGTIGCRVFKTAGGSVYALSNNHVYANENAASIGDSVIQPGTYDGGSTSTDVIGSLSAFKTIIFGGSPQNPPNKIDAAIALSDSGSLGTDTPTGAYGTPDSLPVLPALSMAVTKTGRTTGETFGTITGINAKASVQYSSGLGRFQDQIIISPGSFSAGGDSGSLIVTDNATRSPVGLLFAGSTSITIGNRIGNVLTEFGITVDEGPNHSPYAAVSAPADGSTHTLGASVTFTGTATDSEDGSLTSGLTWSSDVSGVIGTTGSVTTSTLPAGAHKISASATDSAGKTWSRSISITVSGSVPGGTVTVTTPSGTTGYSLSGGKSNSKNLNITVTLKDGANNPVAGASVSISLTNSVGGSYTASATTGSGGTVTFTLNNAPSATYSTTVTSITASGLTWDGVTPANSFTKP